MAVIGSKAQDIELSSITRCILSPADMSVKELMEAWRVLRNDSRITDVVKLSINKVYQGSFEEIYDFLLGRVKQLEANRSYYYASVYRFYLTGLVERQFKLIYGVSINKDGSLFIHKMPPRPDLERHIYANAAKIGVKFINHDFTKEKN